MLRRIATLFLFGATTLTVAFALVAWYQRFQLVPYRSYYTAPCELDAAAAWCGSLHTIFSAGAMLLSAGIVMLVVGLTVGALVVLRVARQRWLTSGTSALAGVAAVGAFWLSQQALEAYYNLSLFPGRSPPEFFASRLAAIDRMSQTYMAWSVGAIVLAAAMLIFSLVILWRERKRPPQTIALTPAL